MTRRPLTGYLTRRPQKAATKACSTTSNQHHLYPPLARTAADLATTVLSFTSGSRLGRYTRRSCSKIKENSRDQREAAFGGDIDIETLLFSSPKPDRHGQVAPRPLLADFTPVPGSLCRATPGHAR